MVRAGAIGPPRRARVPSRERMSGLVALPLHAPAQEAARSGAAPSAAHDDARYASSVEVPGQLRRARRAPTT